MSEKEPKPQNFLQKIFNRRIFFKDLKGQRIKTGESQKILTVLDVPQVAQPEKVPDWITQALEDTEPLIIKEVDLTGLNPEQLKMARIFAKTSSEQTITLSMLGRVLRPEEKDITIAKFKMNSPFFLVKKKFGEIGLEVVNATPRNSKFNKNREGHYYLAEKAEKTVEKEVLPGTVIFTAQDAKEAGNGNNAELSNRVTSALAKNTFSPKEKEVLRIILDATLKNEPISSTLLARTVYDSETSLKVARKRTSVILSILRRLLADDRITIASKHLGKKSQSRNKQDVCYYIALTDTSQSNNPSVVKVVPLLESMVRLKKTENSVAAVNKVCPPEIYPQDAKYKLSNAVICDLGRILRAPLASRALDRFGINISEGLKREINEIINQLCASDKKDDFECGPNKTEVIRKLRESLKVLVGEHREEFKKQSPELIMPILSVFDHITPDKLNSLMDAIHNVFCLPTNSL